MSVKFCVMCDNMLRSNFNNDELTFVCDACQISYQANEEDSLRYEKSYESRLISFDTLLENAAQDPTSFKTFKKCINTKCDSNVVKLIRLGEDLTLFNICIKCETKWLND